MKVAGRIFLFFWGACALVAGGCAALQGNLGAVLGSGGSGTLDEPTVVAGIKEALRVGTQNTVLSTSRLDGFLGNAMIRIAVPAQLASAASTLRTVGLGAQVDELEVGMNRAAEKAAGEARDVFWDAITSMTVSDAFGILRGGDTAATAYFRGRTYATLETRFRPIVRQKIQEVGVSRVYTRIADAYNSLPVARQSRLVDLDDYVTERALSGLFTVLGQEERKIREDPAARTTELLQRVFGPQK